MKDSASSARAFALRLIRYRDRSERELAERLSEKGFPENTISSTITSLKESGLVNDHVLAKRLTEIANEVKLLGNRGTEHFLKKRGIDKDLAAEHSLRESDEYRRALMLVEKKQRSFETYPMKEKAKKIRGLLLRRGYSFETVNKVLSSIRRKGETR